MKLPLTAAPLLLVLVAPFRSTSAPQEPREKHREKHADTELAQHMEKIEDTIKVLRKSMKDEATRPAALEALLEIERLTLTCKTLEPSAAAALPATEKTAMVTAYRRTMVDFLTRQLELEAALLDGDAEKAKTAFERFREMEDPAHERFAPEDD